MSLFSTIGRVAKAAAKNAPALIVAAPVIIAAVKPVITAAKKPR